MDNLIWPNSKNRSIHNYTTEDWVKIVEYSLGKLKMFLNTPISYKRPISATLFIYSNKKKLLTKDGASFLELVFNKDNTGVGNWQSYGWKEDEFEEYGYFDQDFDL